MSRSHALPRFCDLTQLETKTHRESPGTPYLVSFPDLGTPYLDAFPDLGTRLLPSCLAQVLALARAI